MTSPLLAQLRRDLLLAVRARAETVNPLAFFALGVLLFGLANTGQTDGVGAVWTLALFANALAADGMFRADDEDGSLEQLLIRRHPLFTAILGKLLAHWLLVGLPIAALAPLAALALQGSLANAGTLLGALLLGTPTLTCIGAIVAALTLGTGRGGLLLTILAMPLYLPVLIFGIGASTTVADSASFPLLALAALLAAGITVAPFAVGKALAISQEY